MTIAQKIVKYEARVDKGIKWLNKNRPNWLKKIRLAKLDLSDGVVCIIGQAFKKDFNDVIGDLMENGEAHNRGFLDDEDLLERQVADYDLLTVIWYEKIKCMRK